MRVLGALVTATTAIALIGMGAASSAHAAGDGFAMNGIYKAVSNGDWAQTNDRYQDEGTVRATWSVTTTCTTFNDCTGQMHSDQGWSADIYARSGIWYVKHHLDNWQPCADGSTAPGDQMFRFVPVDASARVDTTSSTYSGVDVTTGPSGACGINKSLQITMPFRLDKAT